MGRGARDDRLGRSKFRHSGSVVRWLTKGIGDEPEIGGGLMVGAIQLSIMLGAFGGLLLDHLSIAATLIGGTVLLVLASLTVGNGNRIKASMGEEQAGTKTHLLRILQ